MVKAALQELKLCSLSQNLVDCYPIPYLALWLLERFPLSATDPVCTVAFLRRLFALHELG